MSISHRRGYDAEAAIERLLKDRYPRLAENILRPRAGSPKDKGDIHGLPVVISVKNYAEPHLGPWVDQMKTMCEHANKGVGVVWHKRRGKGNPADWWVTTDDMAFAYLHDKFERPVHIENAGIVLSAAKLSGWMGIVEDHRYTRGCPVGVLAHARKGYGKEEGTFVTMTGGSFLEMLDEYLISHRAERQYLGPVHHG